MAGILSLFGIGARANGSRRASLAPRAQSSIEGRPRPAGAGQNRLAGNIIWYGDYKATPVTEGGKGAGGSGKGTPGSYNYSASFMVAIGETIAAVKTIINGNQYDFFYTPPAALVASLRARGIKPTYGNTYGATFLLGDYAQNPWGYLVTAHPSEALAYRGESIAAFPNLGLGQSATLPNFNFEVLWAINTDVADFGPDANPADWVEAILTDEDWGVGFPAPLLAPLTAYRDWARATGMLVSPLLEGQTAAQAHLGELMQGTIADFVWAGGLLSVVPYADAAVTGWGHTYEPDVTPIYDLTTTDFLSAQGGNTGGEDSFVNVARADPAQTPNQVNVEYLDRANLYNPVKISDEDDANIIATGRRRGTDLRQHHFFCAASAASMSAALQLRRLKVLQLFYFRLPPQFVLLTPMDIVTLTEPGLGLDRQPVRIRDIKENDDGSFSFEAEEFLGVAAPPLYARQEPLGAGRNNNEAPGDINPPLIFEPYEAQAGGLQIWVALSGADLTIWGGADIWVATESGGTYQKVGRVVGNSRMGVLSAILPDITPAVSGQTIDNVNTLSVDLAMSGGVLDSGSLLDMTSLDTACYVGGEIIAYQTATLTGTDAYDLAPMVRGAFGSPISAHAAGEGFARLDNLIIGVPYTQDRIGSTLYFKFQSFNKYGAGAQDLADISPYAYVIQGTALAAPLPDITDLRATYVDSTSAITWGEVEDFRPVRYEIRRGGSWEAGLSLGTVAHPPFVTQGDGNYLVKAVSEPVANLHVESETALAVSLLGTVLPANLVATYDEAGDGWPGVITGPGAIVGPNLVTTAAHVTVYYEVNPDHYFDVLFDRETRVSAEWQAVGVPSNDDILSNPDFLGTADILGASATRNIESWVEIFVSGGDAGDVFSAPDVFALPDVFGGATGDWVRYAPGTQFGRRFKARLALRSNDDATVATAIAFAYSANVNTRADHFTELALGTGGATLDYTPDGGGAPVPFNGGPNGATVPHVTAAIVNEQAGDYIVFTSTLSQLTIQCKNAGSGVARTVNIVAVGW